MFSLTLSINAQNLIAEYESIPDPFAGYEKPIGIAIMKFEGCDNFEQLLYDEIKNNSSLLEKYIIYPLSSLEENKNMLGLSKIEPSLRTLKKLYDKLSVKFIIFGSGNNNDNVTLKILNTEEGKEVFKHEYRNSKNSTAFKDVTELLDGSKRTIYVKELFKENIPVIEKFSGFEIKWEQNIKRKIMHYELPSFPFDINEAGKITLRFVIKADGSVSSIFPLSKVDPGIEKATVNSLWKWKFEPLLDVRSKQEQTAVITLPFESKKTNTRDENYYEETYFTAVEEMPEPIGGLAEIQGKIVFPEIAKRAGVEGRVYVLAFVDENGNVTDAKIIKGIGAGCDEVALDAVKKTKFKPGKQRGKPVKVQVAISVEFKLQ